eukprot:GFKZ01011691.1.p1 GENE.GFKZ01011691.1~~GFKZ01011691.1.p1  ORF type:complete len:119 (+),score=16.63 GFKZ01011691.1:179-535(+)
MNNDSPPAHKPTSSPRSAILIRPVEGVAPPPEFTDANQFSPPPPSDALKLDAIKKNPLVPIGAIGTGAVLLAGLFAFKSGNALLSQRLMRARVVAQGATLGVLAASVGGGMASNVGRQ